MYKLQIIKKSNVKFSISPSGDLVKLPVKESAIELLRHEFELLHYEQKYDAVINWLFEAQVNDPEMSKKIQELHRLEVKIMQLTQPAVSAALTGGIEEISTTNIVRK